MGIDIFRVPSAGEERLFHEKITVLEKKVACYNAAVFTPKEDLIRTRIRTILNRDESEKHGRVRLLLEPTTETGEKAEVHFSKN